MKLLCNPTDNQRLTSPFGARDNPVTGKYEGHTGADFGAKIAGKQGDPLYAVADGEIVISKVNSGGVKCGYGYYIVLQYKIGDTTYCSLYGHLKSLEVKVGKKVKAGQVIAHMGSTGTSTAAHLHFEVNKCKGSEYFSHKSQDPMPCLVSQKQHEALKKEKLKNYVVKKEVNKRSKPNAEKASIVSKLKKGTAVKVVKGGKAVSGKYTFYKIRQNNKYYYVNKNYLKKKVI